MRIAINGMGRIGRLLCKLLILRGHNVVIVNDLMSRSNLAYLLAHDSIYGVHFRSTIDVSETADGILMNEKPILTINEPDTKSLPWKSNNIDLVVDCTGKFLTIESLNRHIQAGAKKVLLSTTGAADVPLMVRGFHEFSEVENRLIFGSGGCMMNCLAPILKHVHRECIIDSVHINVIHSYTTRQLLHDGQNTDFRRGRAAATSIIPVEVDLAESLQKILGLDGRIAASSTRVPVESAALADIYVALHREISKERLHDLFRNLSQNSLKNILEVNDLGIVSRDVICNTHSAIIDTTLTAVLVKHVRLGAWFDDQFGFCHRLLDIVDLLRSRRFF
jgi:glyceraldehyde 3-phosphate dehydrogenase